MYKVRMVSEMVLKVNSVLLGVGAGLRIEASKIRIPYRHMRKRLKNVSKALFHRLTERAGYRLW